MMKSEKVSVIMCTYNGETYLREQLDSIIYQSYSIYELIIQDDNSTDKTQTIVREYASRYPFIKLYINERQLGYNHNFLSALQKATGDVVAFADQDDIWHKEKIMKQVNQLNLGFHLVFHNSYLFRDSHIKPIGKRHSSPPLVSDFRMTLKPFIQGHACLFTNEILPVIKEIYERENCLSYDFVVALACSTLGKVAYLDECLVYWRRHGNAATYNDTFKGYNRVTGLVKSFFSLFQSENKTVIRRYFNAVGCLPFKTVDMQKVVQSLQRQGIRNLIQACLICGRHTSDFFGEQSLKNRIKATFTPLHLFRDGATFLIK
jgi:glycosyltransferase involved in cell wall biosynthesis